jgi:sortase B
MMMGKRVLENEVKEKKEKKPMTKKQKVLLWISMGLCICVMAGSIGYLGHYYWQVFRERGTQDELRDLLEGIIGSDPVEDFTEPVVPPWQPGEDEDPGEDTPESERERERRYLLDLKEKNREVFADLLAINGDFLGTVEIPGLIRSMPYVSARDNDEYLRVDFHGRRSSLGTIFLNAWNCHLLMDNNTVLYGHNIRAGDMFARLLDYRRAATFKNAPIVVLDGLVGKSVWIIFAAYVTEPDWGYVNPGWDPEWYAYMLEEIRARSWFNTNVDVTPEDRILTLSTCDYSYEDMRFAVHARKLRPGEEIPEEVIAVPNPDRKPYNIPSPMKLADITANRTAIMYEPRDRRIYFYQPRTGRGAGIDWYSGDTVDVQGLFNNFTGPVARDSYMSAVFKNFSPRSVFLAADNYNRQQGIQLFNAYAGYAGMSRRGLVTPQGVNARYPLLFYENEDLWLIYTVPRGRGDEIHRLKIVDNRGYGEPELLFTAPHGADSRALDYRIADGMPLLIWHEAANKKVFGSWDGGEAFELDLTGDADRLTFFGAVTNNQIRIAIEKNGKFTFDHFSFSGLPKPAAPLIPDPDPDPADDPGPADDPDPGDGYDDNGDDGVE